MASNGVDRFVRVPTTLLEAILGVPLSGTQWRILLWVIRQTYGWNRSRTPFTWYKMAQHLGISRPAVYRAGLKLIEAGWLVVDNAHVAVAGEQRFAVPADNARDTEKQRKSCQQTTLFRPTKDSKDGSKTYKDTPWSLVRKESKEAGAAAPIPGKYDRLSEN